MLKNIIIMAALLGLALAASGAWAQQGGGSGSGGYISGGLGAWQNPDIGFVYDLKFDYHNADRNWTTRGFELATAELSLGSEIDHFGRMDFNARFMSDGAEIHELFFTMPSLPLGLKARAGSSWPPSAAGAASTPTSCPSSASRASCTSTWAGISCPRAWS